MTELNPQITTREADKVTAIRACLIASAMGSALLAGTASFLATHETSNEQAFLCVDRGNIAKLADDFCIDYQQAATTPLLLMGSGLFISSAMNLERIRRFSKNERAQL